MNCNEGAPDSRFASAKLLEPAIVMVACLHENLRQQHGRASRKRGWHSRRRCFSGCCNRFDAALTHLTAEAQHPETSAVGSASPSCPQNQSYCSGSISTSPICLHNMCASRIAAMFSKTTQQTQGKRSEHILVCSCHAMVSAAFPDCKPSLDHGMRQQAPQSHRRN